MISLTEQFSGAQHLVSLTHLLEIERIDAASVTKGIHDLDARRLFERIVKIFRVETRDAAFHARRDNHRVPKR